MFYHHGAMRREYHDAYGYRKADKVIAVSPALAENCAHIVRNMLIRLFRSTT